MQSNDMDRLAHSRIITGPLCLFDLFLGITAVFLPGFYMRLLQPDAAADPTYLLGRTGMLWLGFSVIQGAAFFWYGGFPEWVLVVAVLRLNDVPADLYYGLADLSLGGFGRLSLLFASVFNTIVGIVLLTWYLRARKVRLALNHTLGMRTYS